MVGELEPGAGAAAPPESAEERRHRLTAPLSACLLASALAPKIDGCEDKIAEAGRFHTLSLEVGNMGGAYCGNGVDPMQDTLHSAAAWDSGGSALDDRPSRQDG